jgi:hypothetical protein
MNTLLNGAAQIEEMAMHFPQFALLHSMTCSTQADNNAWKLRLHYSCQFPWCALALNIIIVSLAVWAVAPFLLKSYIFLNHLFAEQVPYNCGSYFCTILNLEVSFVMHYQV